MKVVEVVLERPWYSGAEGEEKKQADELTIKELETDLGLPPLKHDRWIVISDLAIEIMARLGKSSYNLLGVKEFTVLMGIEEPLIKQLEAAANKMELVYKKLETQSYIVDEDSILTHASNPGWNSTTRSPISGPTLNSFNELKLLEDCCTDELQRNLDEGWRMVAVCPQESRRPDYVLGRLNNVRVLGSSGALR